MLKSNVKKRLVKLYQDLSDYAWQAAAYADQDTDCDESYIKDMNKFEKRFTKLMEDLERNESYTKRDVKR